MLNPALSHGALRSLPGVCVVCVALKGFLSPPGLQLTPLLIDICPRSISIPTLCENRRNYRRNKPLGGQKPQRFIPVGSSFCARKIKPCVRSWYRQLEKRFGKHENKDTEHFGFSRCCFPWWFFSRMILPNALQLAEFWQRICTLASLFFPFYLTGPPRRTIISAFPWTTATKIAQVCCAVLKTWQWALRNTWVFSICISLTLVFFPQMFLLLLCYFGHQNMFFFVCIQPPASWLFFFTREGSAPYRGDHNSAVPWGGALYTGGFLLLGACEQQHFTLERS